ncbi:hypothetical protein [Advenella mimigardefordensis]|uniref:Uncharacterized protein n=1 Tax=Advenella mimigardefordensis (strain DSM 17166 / LMG 22922 / DPN7) TaxID=1247726 RepID=W0PLH7_ADVMD|nr:hypothetical protein [Advenella mimigardefordensis]AHG65833.1 hypothetical protein MIM_c37760 [Advenella mimigardefordensis DPN7]
MPANKSLLFKNNGVSSIEKFEIDASEIDYDAQLEKGLAASRNRTAAFNRVFANSFKKLFMSGGKDSRATLAVLMSVLGNKDFYVHSIDPKKVSDNIKDHVQKDLSIANKISLMFGLKFCELEPELPVRKTPINFEESLSDWQNDFSNVRFNFQPAYYSYAYDDAQYKVQFRGAGGEIYRGYWSEVFKRYETTYKKIQDDSTTVREDAGVIFNALVPGNIIPAQIYNSAKAIFADTVATMPGNAFLQKIDQHYNFLRHRFHFAHGNRGLRLGELMYLPLIDRHFYQASLCLTHSQKTSGKLVFDIVDRINPYLNLIEYDSSAWSQDQLGQSKYLQKASILKLPDFKGSGEYHPKILLDSSKKFEVPSISNSIASSYNRQSALMARLRDNLQFLSKHPQSKIIFNDKLIKLCAQRIDKKQGINSLVGKTESIRDALVTLDINYLSIVA